MDYEKMMDERLKDTHKAAVDIMLLLRDKWGDLEVREGATRTVFTLFIALDKTIEAVDEMCGKEDGMRDIIVKMLSEHRSI